MGFNPYQSFNDLPADPNQGPTRPDRYTATGRNEPGADGPVGTNGGRGQDLTPWERELAEQNGPSIVRTTRSANGDVTINEYFIKNAQFVQGDGDDQGADFRRTPSYLRPSQRGDFRGVDPQFLAQQDREMNNFYRASYIPPPDRAWAEQRRQNEFAYERWEGQQRRDHWWNPNYNHQGNAFASSYNPYAYAGGYGGYDNGINVSAGNRGFGITVGTGGFSLRIGGGGGGNHHQRDPYRIC